MTNTMSANINFEFGVTGDGPTTLPVSAKTAPPFRVPFPGVLEVECEVRNILGRAVVLDEIEVTTSGPQSGKFTVEVNRNTMTIAKMSSGTIIVKIETTEAVSESDTVNIVVKGEESDGS